MCLHICVIWDYTSTHLNKPSPKPPRLAYEASRGAGAQSVLKEIFIIYIFYVLVSRQCVALNGATTRP